MGDKTLIGAKIPEVISHLEDKYGKVFSSS